MFKNQRNAAQPVKDWEAWTCSGFKERFTATDSASEREALAKEFLTHAEPSPWARPHDGPLALHYDFAGAAEYLKRAFEVRQHGLLWASDEGITDNLLAWNTRRLQVGTGLEISLCRSIAIVETLEPSDISREMLIRFIRLNCNDRLFAFRAVCQLNQKRPSRTFTPIELEDWKKHLMVAGTDFSQDLIDEARRLEHWQTV